MTLIRGIDARQAIVAGIVRIAEALGIACVAERAETAEELRTLTATGIRLVQGFVLARPAFEALPDSRSFLPIAG